MQIIELKKGQTLHAQGSPVQTIDIISKGEINVFNDGISIVLKGGTICGLPETPGDNYMFTYQAQTDATIASYPFTRIEDLISVIKANPKIAPILVSNVYRSYQIALDACHKQLEEASALYKDLMASYEQYPSLCTITGTQLKAYPEVLNQSPLPDIKLAPNWRISYVNAILDNDAALRKAFYTINIDIDVAMILTCVQYLNSLCQYSFEILRYSKTLLKETAAFRSAFSTIKSKADQIMNGGEESLDTVPEFKDVLNTLLAFGNVDPEIGEAFADSVRAYASSTVTDAFSDEYRKVRRDVATHFYKVYKAVFLASLSESLVPDVVHMFLMFGYCHEDLVSAEQTATLYRIMKSYSPDPGGHIFTMPEWLEMIYEGQVVPSRNEFNLDYQGYLNEQKSQGNITEEKMNELLEDADAKLDFEIGNLFMLSNRVTFGRASAFVPVFDEANITKPLPDAFLRSDLLQSQVDALKSDDYTIFYRNVMYSNPSIGLNTFTYAKEVMPYFILLPNCGSRISLWQEIEGRKRDTPARYCISIFHSSELSDTLLQGFADYRWEMCKTIQGIHWNDVTDPSLTSEYCDYLQFYKKNRMLTEDQKEKLYEQLKKYSNHYNQVFMSDYITYMKFERTGSLRLNKIARQILFAYCPFSKELREKMTSSPQYGDLVKTFDTKNATAMHTLENVFTKIEKGGFEVPDEVKAQKDFLEL